MEKIKILIVEDEGVVALQLKVNLEKWNYVVSGIVASGEEALKRMEALTPDLVMMDMTLQGKLDGIKTADMIRKQYNIPVIYLTAHSEESTIRRAKETEPYGYILKPFNAQEIRIAIEVALYKHRVDMEKEKLNRDLQAALEKVKLLSGFLPICSICKKIRDDKGYWNQIESYIRDHSEAEFSHGMCPDCARTHYSELFEDEKE
jgi:DNA-binding response OmpR family regulator